MNPHCDGEERLLELLSQRAVEGLSPGESAELRGLAARHPEVDTDMFDEAAAWVAMAALEHTEPMPEALCQRVSARFAARPLSLVTETPPAGHTARAPNAQPPAGAVPLWRRPAPAWFAAAASVLLAVSLWLQGPEVIEREVERVVEVPASVPSPEFLRAGLLTLEEELIRQSWQLAEGYAHLDVHGDVVWSPRRQEGYMRFAGLPANDPGEAQYQLWIFDATRDDSFPVDGGVFDVPPGAQEVIIPIRANIPVREASLFALTREPPGGVMVSSREELLLLAQPD